MALRPKIAWLWSTIYVLAQVDVPSHLLAAADTSTTDAVHEASSEPRNILYIVIDDLRPEMGCYGIPHAHTPNMDALASRSVVFDRAFAQQAVCAPSRNSFLTGRRPDNSRCWNFINNFREDHPEWQTLPGMFKDSGRLTLGVGKIFHPDVPPHYDGNMSWSPEALPYENPCYGEGVLCIPCPSEVFPKLHWLGLNAWCEMEAFDDYFTAERAIQYLHLAANGTRRHRSRHTMETFNASQHSDNSSNGFFLAVGLHKPHLPWQVLVGSPTAAAC